MDLTNVINDIVNVISTKNAAEVVEKCPRHLMRLAALAGYLDDTAVAQQLLGQVVINDHDNAALMALIGPYLSSSFKPMLEAEIKEMWTVVDVCKTILTDGDFYDSLVTVTLSESLSHGRRELAKHMRKAIKRYGDNLMFSASTSNTMVCLPKYIIHCNYPKVAAGDLNSYIHDDLHNLDNYVWYRGESPFVIMGNVNKYLH